MNNKNLILITIIIILFTLALGIFFLQKPYQQSITNFEECVRASYPVMESYPRQCRAQGKTFVEEINSRQYISRSPQECQLIKFLCEPGKKPFFDEQGCGCEADDSSEQNFCTPEQRNKICTKIFQPVCGWNDPGRIQCIKYPCAQTYGNSCEACSDEDVLYWTKGECPN